MSEQLVNSTFLDPDFSAELQLSAKLHDESESQSDDCKWNIAKLVNGFWHEHSMLFQHEKNTYYAECSRIANVGLKKKRFSDSGETLRSWCEVQETYDKFDKAELFLDVLSFKHLRIAKKLARDCRVSVPVLALAEAVRNGWTADEMKQHYDPSMPIHPYEAMKFRIESMLEKKSWEFIKDPQKVKECIGHARAIREIVEQELRKEGKAL